jgi:hypothetical protein
MNLHLGETRIIGERRTVCGGGHYVCLTTAGLHFTLELFSILMLTMVQSSFVIFIACRLSDLTDGVANYEFRRSASSGMN